jgi:hypothetical protein
LENTSKKLLLACVPSIYSHSTMLIVPEENPPVQIGGFLFAHLSVGRLSLLPRERGTGCFHYANDRLPASLAKQEVTLKKLLHE